MHNISWKQLTTCIITHMFTTTCHCVLLLLHLFYRIDQMTSLRANSGGYHQNFHTWDICNSSLPLIMEWQNWSYWCWCWYWSWSWSWCQCWCCWYVKVSNQATSFVILGLIWPIWSDQLLYNTAVTEVQNRHIVFSGILRLFFKKVLYSAICSRHI